MASDVSYRVSNGVSQEYTSHVTFAVSCGVSFYMSPRVTSGDACDVSQEVSNGIRSQVRLMVTSGLRLGFTHRDRL